MAEHHKSQFGMIGLAVMGRNLAFNMLDHGFRVAGYNLEPELTLSAVQKTGGWPMRYSIRSDSRSPPAGQGFRLP